MWFNLSTGMILGAYKHYPFPIPRWCVSIPIYSNTITIAVGIPWESHSHGNSHSHAHLLTLSDPRGGVLTLTNRRMSANGVIPRGCFIRGGVGRLPVGFREDASTSIIRCHYCMRDKYHIITQLYCDHHGLEYMRGIAVADTCRHLSYFVDRRW